MRFTQKQRSFISLSVPAEGGAVLAALLIGAIVTLMGAYPAAAADKECAQLKSADERLACYDSHASYEDADDGSDFAEIQKVVTERLTDPESARMGRFTLVSAIFACLDVNARNRLGGYAGFKTAVVVKESEHTAWVMGGFMDDMLGPELAGYVNYHDQCIVMGEDWKGAN